MTSTLVASALKVTLLQLSSSLDASSAEHRSYLLKKNFEWKASEKPLNPMKETEEEN